MKIFVSGGAGFIGRNLVHSLLRDGNSVTIYDNFSNSTEDKISHLLQSGASVVKGDVTDYQNLLKSLNSFDFAIHLAAKISVEESIKSPELVNEVNVTGTINLLRACVAQKVRNIITASSAAVFGHKKDLPVSENSHLEPISPYGASKLSMEHYVQAFANTYDLNCVTLRFFNVYGNGQSDAYAGVITKFMKNITENKPPVIFGDGSNTRDFVWIEDVISSIRKAMEKIDNKKGICYNIASGKHVSINELAKLMLSVSGKKLDIQYKPPRKGDIYHSWTTISLAQKELGFSPKVGLKEGLGKLLESV